jgi:hypothetical protein
MIPRSEPSDSTESSSERSHQVSWTVYWRGNAELRERIEDELRPQDQPKVKPKKELPDPVGVLAAGRWSRSRSASASQPLRATSRNSSNPWSCVVTKPPMLGLEMSQSENSTGMLPCTSIVVAVRSAFSVNVTERV